MKREKHSYGYIKYYQQEIINEMASNSMILQLGTPMTAEKQNWNNFSVEMRRNKKENAQHR